MLLITLVGACDDDSPSGGGITLDNRWPNDGRGWTYQVTLSLWSTNGLPPEVRFATPDGVPPAPSLTEAATLDVEPTGSLASSDTRLYTLQFEGMHTTESWGTKQHLVATLDGVTVAKAADMPSVPIAWRRRLAVARPDLRARIQELLED